MDLLNMQHVVLDLPAWIILPYLFILGTLVGSFLNVCIYRIPTKDRFLDQLQQLWNRPSHCRRCGSDIRWYDNIPIFGWLKLRGRCRQCKLKISPRYPLIEFFNGCLWVLLFVAEVPLDWNATLADSCLFSDIGPQVYPGLDAGFQSLSPAWFLFSRYLLHLVLVEALLVASMIDFDLRIIPDGSTLPAMAVAVVTSAVLAKTHIVPVWFQSSNMLATFGILVPEVFHPLISGPVVPAWISQYPHLHGLAASLAGLVVGGGIVWAVRILGRWVLQQEAMGFGDVILMAMIGAFLGWQPTVIAFFLAALCAVVAVLGTLTFGTIRRFYGHRSKIDGSLPYGPYLSLGALFTILFWKPVFDATRHIFELGALLIPYCLIMLVAFIFCLSIVSRAKRMLGFSAPDEAVTAVWRSGDQTWFFKGEHVNRHACRWKTSDWEGESAGQGQVHVERWKGQNSSSSSQLRTPRSL